MPSPLNENLYRAAIDETQTAGEILVIKLFLLVWSWIKKGAALKLINSNICRKHQSFLFDNIKNSFLFSNNSALMYAIISKDLMILVHFYFTYA